MRELLPHQYSSVFHLFDTKTINYPCVFSVLEQRSPGHVWVNQLEAPSVCVVRTHAGYAFLGTHHELETPLFKNILDSLAKHSPIKLAWPEKHSLDELFFDAGFKAVDRIQFKNDVFTKGDLSHIERICDSLPSTLHVKIIDEQLLKQSNWHDYISIFFGSADNFLQSGFGLALFDGHELLSEAFACYIGNNGVETGSVTSEKHRGKGYATLIRAFLIKEAFSRGLMPTTSCNADNIGSQKASLKLGYTVDFHYRFMTI